MSVNPVATADGTKRQGPQGARLSSSTAPSATGAHRCESRHAHDRPTGRLGARRHRVTSARRHSISLDAQ
jgi:hypothetical protein